ncbi:pyridoxamine 5'-phosphate oxidase family protein [Nitrosopumilus sp.]|uniref:pyridoxamine 5'-phosphate oxidase family protein n=1 Tax=Nitrosopumilus sp. TaxID=2024843 RepID=UPI002930652F|nr:pyridoxamine 5'-phosphate oxidase family protein [Nitrosopumilus sp.]
MKIINASEPRLGSSMTEDETRNFLSNKKLFARIGSIDKKGDPNVHPVWYYFDNDKIYFETCKDARKAQNIKNKNTIYFCIDDDTAPYKGVRGKGTAAIIQDVDKSLPMVEKLLLKYIGSLDNKMAKFLFNSVKNGESIVIEITPRFFATWDHSKGTMQ